jgi:uncharacterized membrane protein HdeD (DUF308 family)
MSWFKIAGIAMLIAGILVIIYEIKSAPVTEED